jgi:hypothetical protein
MSIHAGINESSLAIGSIFSGSKGQVIDIYDPRKMTEPSIKRARHVTSLSSPAADLHCLPAPDDNFDAVFLIFTAHELRRHKDRLELFREIARGATKRRRIGPGRTRPRLGQLSCIRPGLSSFLLETHLGNRCKLSCAPDKAAYDRHTVCSRVRIAKISMNIYLAMKIAGALLLTLGLAHGFFYRIFEWKKELGQLSVLTRQMFLVHCFFISLSVTLIGACTLFYTDALLRSGTLSRVVLAGFALFWLVRAAFQFFVYDSAIWRGRRFYTFMHVVFSTFWTYLVLVYGAALRVACTYEYYSPTQIRN